jgi:hypothetical protein
MSQDAESQVIAKIKEADSLPIPLGESTNITEKAQLLAFSRFVCNGDIMEQFLFCKPLPETTRGKDVTSTVISVLRIFHGNHALHLHGWSSSFSGRLKRFVAMAKRKNPGIVFTHCFLHREALRS